MLYIDDLSDSERDTLYQNFYDSYVQATGSSWDRDTFDWKAGNWTFFGNENGGIALRHQNSGLWKLNASYGSTREIYKGFMEMLKNIGNEPIWGAMTDNLIQMVEKGSARYGEDKKFLRVPPMMAKLIAPHIAKVFGGSATVNKDGSLTTITPAGDSLHKGLVANKAYYQSLIDQMENSPNTLPIPGIVQKALIGTMKLFMGKNYLPTNTPLSTFNSSSNGIRHKIEVDYFNENAQSGFFVGTVRASLRIWSLPSHLSYLPQR